MIKQFQTLGALNSGQGSKAFLGVEVVGGAAGEPVVLVFVRDEISRDAELLSKLRKETDRAVILEHPNIIRVHGLAKTDEGHARVVEYADGEPLRSVLDTAGKLPVSVAARIAIDAATGIHYAHLAGNDDGTPLVHGDLRPETLMVSFNGHTKVTGYGALGVAPREENGLRVVGRRRHCAPEQLLGGREMVNVATDVYLLGLLLHQCLTGKVPFADQPDPDGAIVSMPLPPLERAVPKALVAVLEKACAKKAQQRYPNALAFRDAVEQAAGELATHEDVANFMRQLFPLDHPQIAARRAMLEKAANDLPKQTADEPTRIIAVETPPRPAAPTLTQSGHHGVVRYEAPRTFSVEVPVYKQAFRWTGVMIATVVVAAGIIALWGSLAAVDHQKVAAVTSIVGPKKDPTTGLMPGESLPPSVVAAIPKPSPAPTTVPAVATTDALPTKPAEPRVASPELVKLTSATADAVSAVPMPDAPPRKMGQLKLSVDPPVEVFIDGRAVGKSPLSVAVPAGKRTVKLVSREHGISIQRSITVSSKGETEDHIAVGRGYLNVTGPEGSQVFINGRKIGSTPISEHRIYEGAHKIEVNLNGAVWKQDFKVKPDERLAFDVHTES